MGKDSINHGEQQCNMDESGCRDFDSLGDPTSCPDQAGPVVLKVKSGLCNRLRTLASFYAFAKESKRPFLLNWDVSDGWSDERFDDLFENRINQISTEKFFEYERAAVCLHREMHQDNLLPALFVKNSGFDATLLTDPSNSFAYFGHFELTMMMPEVDVLWPDLIAVYKDFLRDLRPVRPILNEIEHVSTRFNSSTTGVHIRRGDALQTMRADHYLVSSDRAFIRGMERLIEQDDTANFFLATDCERTQELIKDSFGKRIIVNENKQFVESKLQHPKDNQADAVIDLWLLSRTNSILGNNWSSFSNIAAVIGDIAIEIVRE